MNEPPVPKIAAIVLAAGLSRRMGAFKPLIELGGKPMLLRVVETLSSLPFIDHVVVVTGHESGRVQAALSGYPVTAAFNFHYAAGEMISSVQTGFRALPDQSQAAVLAFADQPGVKPATVATLFDLWCLKRAPIVLPEIMGKRGHPILLSMSLRDEILSLKPGETLKTVVDRHRKEAISVLVDDPAILEDMDTPEDVERWNRERLP